MNFINILDASIILFISFILYRLLKKTEAMKIIFGIMVVYIFSIVFRELQLVRSAAIFEYATNIFIWGLVIIFHPELRMALKKIGGGITTMKFYEQDEVKALKEIEDAVFKLAENKIGALIIFDPNQVVAFQSENYIPIGATCTKELIETIFQPVTPLHDGAIIIQRDRIQYAGCKLPISGKKIEGYEHFGTRHIAAMETAKKFDLTAVVVSEETGNISVVNSENIYRVEKRELFRTFFKTEKVGKNWLEKIKKKN